MEEGMIATLTRPEEVAETEREMPGMWHVVLLDDDDHTYDYVISMCVELFAHEVERAYQIARRVDADGRAVLMTTHKELAELKLEQVHAFGRDELIAGCQGAMAAVLEPADFAGDDGAE